MIDGSASSAALASAQGQFAAASSTTQQRELQGAYALFVAPASVVLVRQIILCLADLQVYVPLLIATFRGFIPALRDHAETEADRDAPISRKLSELDRVVELPTRGDRLRQLRVLRRDVLAVSAAVFLWSIALAVFGCLRVAHSDRSSTSSNRSV